MLRPVWRGALLSVLASACSFQIAAEGVGRDGASDDARGDGAQIDAAIVSDAPMIDAAVILDAPPVPCTTAGLVCPGGTNPHLIPCGFPGECWVGCRDGSSVDYDTARDLCATWGGKLGWITNPLEEVCLRQTIDGAIALGLVQADNQLLTGLGWTWNGDPLPPLYIGWALGQPNDDDGFENNVEQCAYSSTSSTWQDEACTSTHSRFTCRR